MSGKLNIIKLSVGSENIAMLSQWQEERRAQLNVKYSLHITRMWPKEFDSQSTEKHLRQQLLESKL